ncbi:hypothetical protein [Ramlibacter rhizophilus]|nr:hypothetical protein [Ramlibacter rhizophilus]
MSEDLRLRQLMQEALRRGDADRAREALAPWLDRDSPDLRGALTVLADEAQGGFDRRALQVIRDSVRLVAAKAYVEEKLIPGRLGEVISGVFGGELEARSADQLAAALSALNSLGEPWPSNITAAVERHLLSMAPAQIQAVADYLPEDLVAFVQGLVKRTSMKALDLGRFSALMHACFTRLHGHDSGDGKHASKLGKPGKAGAAFFKAVVQHVLAEESPPPSPSARRWAASLYSTQDPACILGHEAVSIAAQHRLLVLVMACQHRLPEVPALLLQGQRNALFAQLKAAVTAGNCDEALRRRITGLLASAYDGQADRWLSSLQDSEVGAADRHARFIEAELEWLRSQVDPTGDLYEPKAAMRKSLLAFRVELRQAAQADIGPRSEPTAQVFD